MDSKSHFAARSNTIYPVKIKELSGLWQRHYPVKTVQLKEIFEAVSGFLVDMISNDERSHILRFALYYRSDHLIQVSFPILVATKSGFNFDGRSIEFFTHELTPSEEVNQLCTELVAAFQQKFEKGFHEAETKILPRK